MYLFACVLVFVCMLNAKGEVLEQQEAQYCMRGFKYYLDKMKLYLQEALQQKQRDQVLENNPYTSPVI